MKWKINYIPLETTKRLKNIRIFMSLLGAVWLNMLVFLLFYSKDIYTLILVEIFANGLVLTLYLNMWFSELNNPKYIKWDEKGVYVITLGKKKHFTPWNEICLVQKNIVHIKGEHIETYILAKKKIWSSNYLIEKRIGEELYYEWLKHRSDENAR